MAFKFNAILKWDGAQAATAMNQTKKGFKGLQTSASNFGNSLGKLSQGIRGLTIATAPFAAAFGASTKTAADFEEQISIVQSVMRASKDDMVELEAVTKQLGATTAFTAKEAGEGAEFLARAGFKMEEVIAALPGVLDAAAASGVSLAEAADVVAGNIGAFGLKAQDAAMVADTLALTTSLTNTNFTQLAESIKFAAPAATQAGISFSEVASAMGVLANAGVKGSLAGTAMKNALNQLATPSKDVLKLFGGRDGLNAALIEIGENGERRLRPMEVIMRNISKATAAAKDPMEAVETAANIFGLRGATAFNAFQQQLGKTEQVTAKDLPAIQKHFGITAEEAQKYLGKTMNLLELTRIRINAAEGSAKEMAAIRLDNLKGQFTLFQSAVSGLAIEVGSLSTGPMQGLLKRATDFISVMAAGFQLLNVDSDEAREKIAKGLGDNGFGHLLGTMEEFAKGFVEGFNEVKEVGKEVFMEIKAALAPFLGESKMTTKEIGKLVAKIFAFGAIAAPILASVAAGFFVIAPIITSISGAIGLVTSAFTALWSIGSMVIGGINLLLVAFGSKLTVGAALLKGFTAVLSAVFSPMGAIVAAVGAIGAMIWGIYKNWETVKAAFRDEGFWTGIVVTFGAMGDGLLDVFRVPFNWAKEKFGDLFAWIGKKIKNLGVTIAKYFGSLFMGDDNQVRKEANLPKSPPREPTPISENKKEDAVETSKKLQEQQVKQKSLVQPPSAQATGAAVGANVSRSIQQTQTQKTGPVQIKGNVTVKGKDLNIALSNAQIEQSELQGNPVAPDAKRKIAQNGQPLTGVN